MISTKEIQLICISLITIVLISNVPYASADRLVFKSGSSLDGVILEEDSDRVVFRARSGEVATYSKSVLQSVVREETALGVAASDIFQRVAALRQAGKLDEALHTLLQAVSQEPQMAPAFAETFQALLYQLESAIKDALNADRYRARELLKTRMSVLQSTQSQLLVPNKNTLDLWLRTTAKSLAQTDYEIAVAWASDKNKLREIRELLLEAVALDSQNIAAHLYLGNVALAIGDLNLAVREYKTVLGFPNLSPDFAKQAQEGLNIAQSRLAQQPPKAQIVTATQPTPTGGSLPKPEVESPAQTSSLPKWLAVIVARLESTGIMNYIRPVWRELSSGQYNSYFIGVPTVIFFFWLLPYWFIRFRSRKGDVYAAELRERARRLGLIAVVIYAVRAAKAAKPKNRCPFCNKSLDKLDAYTDLNFFACPHCHEAITPIYDLKDYIDHLVKQLELQLKHSKDNVIAGIERDLMLKLVRSIITLAVRKRASDLHLEMEIDAAKLRLRVDGMMYDFMHLPRSVALAFISALKIMANLDITERRIPQDGKIGMWIDKTDLDLRINTSPAAMGEKVTIRILNQKAISVDPAKLGLEGENLERFERAIHRPHGMIIVTGPAGSGKSTTLYVALNAINTGEKNIVTLEDPIEYQIKGASQMQVNPATNFTFAIGLRSILRQDPDVIMVGEIRDSETAEIAVEAALTGHMLLTTLHTIDSATAFARMADLGVDTIRMASALICIIAQRLVRTICQDCAKPYKPRREHLEQLNIVDVPKDFVFIRGGGCEICMNTGYCGRIGIFEFLMPDDQMREVLESAPPVSVIRELARKKGFPSLKDEGLRKVWAGLTTVEEVLRVTS